MKKNLLKRLVALGLAGAMVFSLAACGNNDDDKGSDTSKDSSNSKQESKVTNTDGATLRISVAEGYLKYMDEVKGKFEEENNVTIEVIERDMFEQLEALPLDGPAGQAPDIMMSAYDRIGALGQQGHLAEVTLANDKDYDDTDRAQVTVDGKLYGAPAVIETLVLYYNKDLIDKAPATFAEAEELAKDSRFAFESEAGKNTGFLAKWTDFYFSYGLIAGHGGYVFGDNGTDSSDVGLNNEGALEAYAYAKSWFQDVWPQGMLDTTGAGDLITKMFIEGKSAAIIDGPWQAQAYTDAGVNFGVAQIPVFSNGNAYQAFGGGKAWVINSYTENPELAQKWLDYVTNEENQYKFYQMTHEVPANNAARATASSENNELVSAVIAQYADAQPMPNIPEMGEVWPGAQNLMFDIGSGTKEIKAAADEAVQLISESIEQKY